MKHEITDQGDPKKYWTQIPNIVFDLGLKPFELVLYSHLKRAAGASPSGKCTKSTATLARETGMGAGTVSRAKTELEKRRTDLGNNSLIKTRELTNPRGGKPFQEISITDIWKINVLRFTSSTEEIETEQVPLEVEPSSRSTSTPISTGEIKKNNKEKQEEKLIEENQPPDHVVFGFWKDHFEHPRAHFDERRKKAVNARLRDGYSVDDLILAVRGCKLSPHNMGENDRQEVYDDLELICRDTSHVERFIARAEIGVNGNGNGRPKTQSERNVANIQASMDIIRSRTRQVDSEEPISGSATAIIQRRV